MSSILLEYNKSLRQKMRARLITLFRIFFINFFNNLHQTFSKCLCIIDYRYY